jgi:hypothetical protein
MPMRFASFRTDHSVVIEAKLIAAIAGCMKNHATD